MVDCVQKKLNVSIPTTSCQKLTELGKEWKLCAPYKKCMTMEVAADTLGEEWKGYVWISGRKDKQSFPMKQGTLSHGRVCLLLL